MDLTKRQIGDFQTMIFSWWKNNRRRNLPWRHTRDPYHILISEVMLQQTQVLRVIPKYDEFLKAFPDIYNLANASSVRVLTVWRGMGYNRRALYLQRTAETVVEKYHGEFPKEERLLTKLPGLGIYTARALLVFAFEKDVSMVDTNIRQIITHFFFHGRSQKEKDIQEVADQLLPIGKSWVWHQALMDYGALELPKFRRPERSRRTSIPFRDSNRFYRGQIVDLLRDGDIPEKRLITGFSKKYKKPFAFFRTLIGKLMKDGLVSKNREILQLPK